MGDQVISNYEASDRMRFVLMPCPRWLGDVWLLRSLVDRPFTSIHPNFKYVEDTQARYVFFFLLLTETNQSIEEI